ncbi:MAG: hypothetical protein KJ718_00710 [Nanoarchaeota archaeon]|nr:hypothetical protein [Nanoarchaeota archaeon]MBU1051061.1 hypothetical protein [Nanoarchaeota archaeon]MBU1987912.1 hypothetical protein [Nanoarchaeota archaeon]
MKYYPKTLALLACLIVSLNLVSATYLSGDIYLDKNGQARFDLETDIPLDIPGTAFQQNKITGTTPELVTYQKGVWTFELALDDYDDIFLDIHLPRGLDSITEIKGTNNIIDFQNKIITLADSGTLNFKVSYKLKDARDLSFIYWIIFIILLIAGFFIYRKIKSKKERFNHIMPLVGDKEEQIINILMEKPMRQKELRKALNIPKASFTRYILNLEKKKLIIREGDGKNKVIRLK